MARSLVTCVAMSALIVGCAKGGSTVVDDAPSADASSASRGGQGGRGGGAGGALGMGGAGGTLALPGPDAAASADTGEGVRDASPVETRPDAAALDTAGPSPDGGGGAVLTAATAGPAAPLVGYRWEVPCTTMTARDTCPWNPALLERATPDPALKLKIEEAKTFGGERGIVYDVALRFRGVTEAKNFTGGTVEQNHFQIGGTPVSNDYNIYSIKVSDPPATYTLNRNQKKTGHYLFVIDYTVTVKIRGGATVTLGTYDPNTVSIANPGGASGQKDPFLVPGVAPFPKPFHGQFIQMDVVSVAPAR